MSSTAGESRGTVNDEVTGEHTLNKGFTFSSALAFADVSPIVALYAIFTLALFSAGPAFFWAFPVVLAGQLLVAAVFGELSSRYPFAGSVYQWARHAQGTPWGWFAAWAYIWGLTIALSTLSYGAAGFLLEIFGVESPSGWLITSVALLIIAVGTLTNMVGRSVLRTMVLASRGYAVALMSPSGKAEDLAKELGGIGLTGSVTEEVDLKSLVGETLDRYGRIDGVINSTGHPASGEILELTNVQWHEALDLVVLNVVRMARLVTPAMLGQGGGAIVNVSTFSAFEPSPVFPLSSSLRAALAGFAKLYADRYAAEGLRMNNILPGYIESFEIDEETRRSIPMRRQGSVAEIAKTAAFLLSEDSGYVTGQNIRVDGGLTRSV